MKITTEKAIELAAANLYGNIYIHQGMRRRVVAKRWEGDGKIRTYITIACYTMADRYKCSYRCGYIDEVLGEYVVTHYDDLDLTTGEQPN